MERILRASPVVGILLLAGCATHSHAVAPEAARFSQGKFVASFWVTPPTDQSSYQELAGAGFNLVVGGPNQPEEIRQQLDICEKVGLPAIVPVDKRSWENVVEDHPALAGYLWWDEPPANAFPKLAEDVAEMHRRRPGKLLLINLLPNYAVPGQWGTPTYGEYVRRFVDEVKPEVLCMDHYPRFRPDEPDGRDGYCANLQVMRTESLRAGIPFWNFFNTMPYGPHTDPTEAQLRWQIYAALAYGAKGVLYFCYQTPGGDEFPKGGAIIGRDGRRTRHYNEAKRLNSELEHLGPTLMALTSTRTLRVGPTDDPATVLVGGPIRNLSGAADDPKPDYLVGEFVHRDGRRAVLLQNYRFAYSAWPTVEFDAAPGEVLEVDKASGRSEPVHDASPDLAGLQVSLDAGEGRLFLLPAK